jgi:hypothetical protein
MPVPLNYRRRFCNSQPPNGLRTKLVKPAPNEPVSGCNERWMSFCALQDAKLMTKGDNLKL